jgi:protein TonB
MFDQTFVNTNARTRKPWTVVLSLGLQGALVAIALLVPILNPESLHPKVDVPVWISIRHFKSLPPETPRIPAAHPAPVHPAFDDLFHAPGHVPRHVDMTPDAPEMPEPALARGGEGAGITSLPGLTDILPERAEPRPSPAPHAVSQPPKGPVRVGTGVQSARLVFGPRPPYPQLAKTARVQGTVRIQALVALDGTIRNLQVMNGPPLLVKAALDAVSQWRYQPTLLNGSPVEVITEIDVNFTLSQ